MIPVIVVVTNLDFVFPFRLLVDICERDFRLSLAFRPQTVRQIAWVWTKGEGKGVFCGLGPEPGLVIDWENDKVMHVAVGPAKSDLEDTMEFGKG